MEAPCINIHSKIMHTYTCTPHMRNGKRVGQEAFLSPSFCTLVLGQIHYHQIASPTWGSVRMFPKALSTYWAEQSYQDLTSHPHLPTLQSSTTRQRLSRWMRWQEHNPIAHFICQHGTWVCSRQTRWVIASANLLPVLGGTPLARGKLQWGSAPGSPICCTISRDLHQMMGKNCFF